MNTQKNYYLNSNKGSNKEKYQVVKELMRKYSLKELLEIFGLSKSVYYYYEHQKDSDKYQEVKGLLIETFEASKKHMVIEG